MSTPRYFPSKKTLYILCSFWAGFSLMTIELLASRIVAPIIGSSVYTWTAIIGITLLGLAVGSFMGGVIADRSNTSKSLPVAFLLSAILTFLVSPLSQHTNWLTSSPDSVILLNISMAIYLFLAPAIALGAIQPIILKEYSTNFSKIGSEYGRLSTVWSLGSILGVFLTGFYFVSTFGSQETILLISIILVVVSGVISFVNKKIDLLYSAIILLIIISGVYLFQKNKVSNNKIVYEQETDYYKIRVVDFNLKPYGHSRALMLDFDSHSIDSENKIDSQYTEIYPAFKVFNSEIKDILVIGAGAYTLPRHLKKYYPESNVSVIEIDPAIEPIAEKYFGLETEQIETIVGDARQIINRSDDKYDLIYGDAYNSFISVPGHILTKEFNDKIKEGLNPRGLYAINFISALSGENADLFKSLLNTFRQTFPNYYVFAFDKNPKNIQNITLVGRNDAVHEMEVPIQASLKRGDNPFLADKLVISPKSYEDQAAIILTDNLYPVEQLMSKSINNYFPGFLAYMKRVYE